LEEGFERLVDLQRGGFVEVAAVFVGGICAAWSVWQRLDKNCWLLPLNATPRGCISADLFLAALPPVFDELRTLEWDLMLSNAVASAFSTVNLGMLRFA
jgi:hypothetical protein